MNISDAIRVAKSCKMELETYDNRDLLDLTEVFNVSVSPDHKDNEVKQRELENIMVLSRRNMYTNEESIQINKDLLKLHLRKTSKEGLMPTHEMSASDGKESKGYMAKRRSSFVSYNGSYIRKVTALYLLRRERNRLMTVCCRYVEYNRSTFFTGVTQMFFSRHNVIRSGGLCEFKRLDCNKYLLGRIVQ